MSASKAVRVVTAEPDIEDATVDHLSTIGSVSNVSVPLPDEPTRIGPASVVVVVVVVATVVVVVVGAAVVVVVVCPSAVVVVVVGAAVVVVVVPLHGMTAFLTRLSIHVPVAPPSPFHSMVFSPLESVRVNVAVPLPTLIRSTPSNL
jgi:hypothetical protein